MTEVGVGAVFGSTSLENDSRIVDMRSMTGYGRGEADCQAA